MKRSFSRILKDVIIKSDIIIHVLDARMIQNTINADIVRFATDHDKRIIYCVNKADLLSDTDIVVPTPYVFVSTKTRKGMRVLREMIYKVAAKNKSETILIGVVGYPNTGKSSIINTLKGRASAPVSSKSGHTRGEQVIRVSARVRMLDTPGVIPIAANDSLLLAILASKNPQEIKDVDLVAIKILGIVLDTRGKQFLKDRYGVDITEASEESIEKIALAKNRLLKGGVPDIKTTCGIIIQDWQKGLL
ncbi:MAG: ribosome biogenesis GTPase A [Candidatus Woesearchaeota archaeon]|jgi:ribosome biogenesis GTPase A